MLLSIRPWQVSGKPIKLVGRGERMEDLEPFYPDRMAGRILGMGDVLSFVEKAQEVVSIIQVYIILFNNDMFLMSSS